MTEMAVLVIRIRADQASDYEKLFESDELGRWRDYHSRGEHDSDAGFRRFNERADRFQAEEPFVFGGLPLFQVG